MRLREAIFDVRRDICSPGPRQKPSSRETGRGKPPASFIIEDSAPLPWQAGAVECKSAANQLKAFRSNCVPGRVWVGQEIPTAKRRKRRRIWDHSLDRHQMDGLLGRQGDRRGQTNGWADHRFPACVGTLWTGAAVAGAVCHPLHGTHLDKHGVRLDRRHAQPHGHKNREKEGKHMPRSPPRRHRAQAGS